MKNFVYASQVPACDIGDRDGLRYRGMPKRLVDLAIVFMAAPFVLPLLGVFWLLVRLDGGPGFYVQPRVGRRGARFNFYKLRTMVVDSEAALATRETIAAIARPVAWMFTAYDNINPGRNLVEGRLLSWGALTQGFAIITSWAIGVLFAAWQVFKRRELAIYSGH